MGLTGTTHEPMENHEKVRMHAPVQLVPEPTNPVQKEAIRVHVGGHSVGYIPGDKCAQISPATARGHVVKLGTTPAPHVWLFLEK